MEKQATFKELVDTFVKNQSLKTEERVVLLVQGGNQQANFASSKGDKPKHIRDRSVLSNY
jgi:hypothetical protein